MSIDRPAQLSVRIAALDTIAAVLPMERRDELAELLTDQDVETLCHLVNQGMGCWFPRGTEPAEPIADSELKPAGIPINYRPPFRLEAGHDSNQLPAVFRL